MTDKERIAELEKEKKKLLESVEGATAMYIDLQYARKWIAELESQIEKMKVQLEKMKVQHFTDIRLYTKVIGIAVEESVMKDKRNYKNYLFDKAKKILSMGVDK